MSAKTYIGKGRASEKYDLVNTSICLTDIPTENITKAKNGKDYVNLTVARMKETDEWNKTHTVYIDTWKPEPKEEKDDLAF